MKMIFPLAWSVCDNTPMPDISRSEIFFLNFRGKEYKQNWTKPLYGVKLRYPNWQSYAGGGVCSILFSSTVKIIHVIVNNYKHFNNA